MKCFWTVLLLISSGLLQAQVNPNDSTRVSRLLEKAREGQRESQVQLGLAYQYGIGISPDWNSAEYWLKTAAGYGDPRAQTQLGVLYLQPQYRDLHGTEATRWFMRAAVADFAPAEHNLGLAYMRGIGTKANEEEALRWFRKAANHGSLDSQVYAGMILLNSHDPRKQAEGLEAIRKAANRGNGKGMNVLGICYETGKGTSADVREAARWYKRAAEAGQPDAMRNLAVLYLNGKGVPKDPEEAFRLDRRACERGYPGSCAAVAVAYMSGNGTEQNYAMAYQFGLSGSMDQKFLTFVGAGLSGQQKSRATVEAERWQHEHALQLSIQPQ